MVAVLCVLVNKHMPMASWRWGGGGEAPPLLSKAADVMFILVCVTQVHRISSFRFGSFESLYVQSQEAHDITLTAQQLKVYHTSLCVKTLFKQWLKLWTVGFWPHKCNTASIQQANATPLATKELLRGIVNLGLTELFFFEWEKKILNDSYTVTPPRIHIKNLPNKIKSDNKSTQ